MRSRSPLTHVCPWWAIRSFDNPLRRLVQNPEKILRDLVRPGYHCLDIGCGYGYFTIPLARLVGPTGSVTAVDLQAEMLEGVRRRAGKESVLQRIRFHQADTSGLRVSGVFDVALAFWMMHEVQDQEAMLAEVCGTLKVGGHLLLVEPRVHVNAASFDATVALAERCGFSRRWAPEIFFSRSLVLAKTELPAA